MKKIVFLALLLSVNYLYSQNSIDPPTSLSLCAGASELGLLGLKDLQDYIVL